MSARRCAQCWREKPPADFIGARGGIVRRCAHCRAHYGNWDKKKRAEKLATPRKGIPQTGALTAHLVRFSTNVKLGGIPVSITGRASCPPSCGFFRAGCYAEFHLLAYHWKRVSERGSSWADFCGEVARLPEGQLWRHNEAGDLPGAGDRIDGAALFDLALANVGRRGFTFTHKPVLSGPEAARNRRLIAAANRAGFVVNLSADSLEDADRKAALGIAPVSVVLAENATDAAKKTRAGRTVTVCPAQTRDLTCASCRLCAVPERRAIVGFRAHGQARKLVTDLVQLRVRRTGAA